MMDCVIKAAADVVEKFLAAQGITYTRIQNNDNYITYRLDYDFMDKAAVVYVWLKSKPAVCHIDVMLAKKLPGEYETFIYSQLCEWNKFRMNGAFVYDRKASAVYYSCRCPVFEGLDRANFETIFDEAIMAAGEAVPAALRWRRGELTVEEKRIMVVYREYKDTVERVQRVKNVNRI